MKVSVCMATYNGGKYVAAQLRSILAQLSEGDEVLISDDGSEDNTLEVISRIRDSRINVLPRRGGQSVKKNFEYLLSEADGEIIFLSDQDDEWVEGKVRSCLETLETCDIVVTDCKVVDDSLDVLTDSFFRANKSGHGLVRNLYRNSYVGCCMAFRKSVLSVALPFPEYIPMHDIWLGFVGELFFKTSFKEEQLVLYRRHGGNLTFTGGKSGYDLWSKIKFRLNIIRYIPKLVKRRYF